MSAIITPPVEVFHDIDGKALESGFIYIGEPNLDPETNPIAVYWDEALTVSAEQPLRTINGVITNSGSSANAYTNRGTYSITSRNRNGALGFTNLTHGDPIQALYVADYAALRSLSTVLLAGGTPVYITDEGISGQGTLRNVVSHGLPDDGGVVIVINSDWYWKRDNGAVYNAKWFGVVGDYNPNAETGTDNVAAFSLWRNAVQAAADAGGEVVGYIPAGNYSKNVTTGIVDALVFHGHVNLTIRGDGPDATILWDTGGGSSVQKTGILIGRPGEDSGLPYPDIHAATLAEIDADDYSNILTSGITVRDIGFGCEPSKKLSGNMGIWCTNSQGCWFINIGNHGCSTPINVGNDVNEACENIIIRGVMMYTGGRWYVLFVGQSQKVVVSDITCPKFSAPNLQGFQILTSRNVTITGVSFDGTKDGVTFTGQVPFCSFQRSANCVISGFDVSNSNTACETSEAFNLAVPGGSENGPTHHVIGPGTFRDCNTWVKFQTENNIAQGIAGDTSTISKTNPNVTLTLSSQYEGVGVTATASGAIFTDLNTDRYNRIKLGDGVAVITGFTSTTVVTVEVLADFASPSLAPTTWDYITGSTVFLDSGADRNDVFLTREAAGQEFIRDEQVGVGGNNLLSYGLFDRTGRAIMSNGIYFRQESDPTSLIAGRITKLAQGVGVVFQGKDSLRLQVDSGNYLQWNGSDMRPSTTGLKMGDAAQPFDQVIGNRMVLTGGIAEPSTISVQAQLYIDVADGDLKVKFGNGTVVTLAAN